MMIKRIAVVFLIAALLVSAGCKTTSTTILNSEYKIFYGGSQIEATVRELSVDGGTTSVRVHFLNLGTEELGSLEALVEFVDSNGEVVTSSVISATYDTPLAVGESVSETVSCDSDSRITGVYVSDYTPES
ncbi:hypothetical protein SDC9_122223 [bioreactor metagenome]|uniref:Uncharacterized protein n=1 Tax=bioreactor metagenome TaxID=1076179 RepID=A0A645CEE9_9ZZZZ|nr:hypothetical protein [Christensenella sp.]